MQPFQLRELWRLFFLVLGGIFIGLLIKQLWMSLAVVLGGYSAYTLRNSFKLHNWLLHRNDRRPPEAQGYWGEIFNEIYLMVKDTRRNRARLTGMLTRFQNAASALPDGTVVLSKRNEIEWANPAAFSMLGIRYPADSGQQISNLVRHPGFRQYLASDDFSKTIKLPSPVRQAQVLELQIIPYGSSQKLILIRDITHITRLEEMRRNFVANASHELRSPITVLSGYLETLRNIEISDKDQLGSVLATMHEQSKRMERLVADLLALSKLETEPAGRMRDRVDVPAMLASLAEGAHLLDAERNHHIQLEAESDLALLGNYEELYSLFSNLISNAVRYTPANGNITIRWQHYQAGAQFSVEDTGPGIAARHIPHITERFYRVDVDRSRETGGTGLGLAIVKHVLERHDGVLNIKSEPGKGSTFICQFPAERVINIQGSSEQ